MQHILSISCLFLILYFTIPVKNEYDLNQPKSILILPDILREISGITRINDQTIACIQDENGILFIYDITRNKIEKQYRFNIDGDYEGITLVNNVIYILRSDGVLFEIDDYKNKNYKLKQYVTGIPSSDNEGLCYDLDHHRLLLASKGKSGKNGGKNLRTIYSFDLETKKLSSQPILSFNITEIEKYAKKLNIKLPESKDKDGKIEHTIKFKTSEIAIHPFNKNLYLLSAVDQQLFIFSMKGTIEDIQLLNPHLFQKAEGITFLSNGDMLISNEAKGKKPTLLCFPYHQTKK